ncbi:MAG: YbfB/YjiJ family MFS transporter [Acetobacteraceae bacterium]|nr:YbfB/YjiJ family MFS transporter [Acetobacteraceae bacterium]
MRGFLRPALAGAAATCAGNGLARFAYVPIFPAMVGAGWVDGGGAGLLGAAALGGYLVGTLGGRAAARRIGVPGTLDLGMALVVLALAACAWNGGFAWLMGWRGMAGVAGGLLMALAGPATQASVAPHRRGAAGGVVLAGVGTGIVLGAVVVPVLLAHGLPATWLGLAGLVLALWLAVRRHWPDMELGGAAALAPPRARLLLATYGLHSAGMVAPMVYLADLAARGRGLGVAAGALAWLLFGLGGIAGGVLSGRLVDRIGGRLTLALWLGVQVVALALALVPDGTVVLVSAVVAGFAAVGVTTVTLSVCREVAPAQSAGLWVRATAVFGVVQTAVAFAVAPLFAATGESHAAVFGVGLVSSVAALAAAVALARRGSALP